MHALTYHTFTHLPRFFIQRNTTHSPSTRLLFHDCGIGSKKTTMARRNFIKAYNDMVSGSGQSNVGGLNISEFANNGPFPREVDAISRKSSMKLVNKEKAYPSRYVVNPPKPSYEYKPPSPTRNVQAGVSWGCVKQKDRNLFVDIDGEAFPSEELHDKGVEVIDTSHKIQRHISLVDLARPYVPRAPGDGTKMRRENHEKEEMVKKDEPIRTKTLPKGFSGSDQPYVLPKFTPTFKEMISTRSKKDTLVSITESTPPSMQKWAIEWNSEPKHSISIAELKEDLMREKYGRATQGPGNKEDIIYAEEEPPPSSDGKPQEKGEPIMTKSMDGTLNTLKPRDETGYYYYNNSESIDTFIEPTQYMQGQKQMEAKDQANNADSKPSLDWLPEKYEGMKRIFNGIPKETYSFKQAIRENMNDDRQQKSSIQNKVSSLQGTTDREFSFDVDRQQFHQWFRRRLTRSDKDDANGTKNAFVGINESCSNSFYATGSDPYITSGKKLGLESITYSEGDPTRSRMNEKPSRQNIINENTGVDQIANSSSSITDCLPSKDDVKERPAEQYPSERNSSFYHWLKQRGLINVMKNRMSEKHKPARTEEVVKPGPTFPWSTSYMCKYVPGTPANRKERKDSRKDSKPAGIKHFRDAIPLRKAATQSSFSKKRTVRKKVRSQGSFEKIDAKNSSLVQEKSRMKRNRPENDGGNEGRSDGQLGRIPYYGWAVDNELDHVKNLRFMENNHVAPQVMNRKKLFPSLHEQISKPSLNYWESKYTKTLTTPKAPKGLDLYSNGMGADLSGTVAFGDAPGKNRKESGSTANVAKLSKLFDDKNFINISEDPTVPFKLLFNNPEEQTSLNTNLSNRAEVDESKISRSAMKLSQTTGKRLASGNPTLIAKLAETSEIPEKDSPIHLQFARYPASKTDEGLGKLQDSSKIDMEDEFSGQGLEADGNEVDEDWIHMISPNDFNSDHDGDLIHFLKKSASEFKPSFASPRN